MKVLLVAGQFRQHTIWVRGLIKWHLSAVGVITSRREVTRGKLHRVEMTELTQRERFHVTLWHLARKYLMQLLKCVNTGLELLAFSTQALQSGSLQKLER